MHFSNFKFLSVVVSTTLLFHCISVKADHMFALDMFATCLGQDTAGNDMYRVTYFLYRDCRGVPASTSQTICIRSSSCGYSTTQVIKLDTSTGAVFNPYCPAEVTKCEGGSFPGIEKYIYCGIIILPFACTDWRLIKPLCCRSDSIKTIPSPGATGTVLMIRIDNVNAPCNSLPVFSNPPIIYNCVNEFTAYAQGMTEPDGDSLVITMINAQTNSFGCTNTLDISYLSPYTSSQPLTSVPAVTFDSITGDITMTPTVVGETTVFGIRVEEYRNGMKVGEISRAFQVRVITCNNPTTPTLTGMDSSASLIDSVCANSAISFKVYANEVDTSQNAFLSWDTGIVTATFDTAGDASIGTFSWTPTDADTLSNPHTFTVTVSDDGCLSKSRDTTFTIYVLGRTSPGSIAGMDTVCPYAQSVSYSVNQRLGSTYQWFVMGGSQVAGGNSDSILVDWTGSSPSSVSVVETNLVGCIGDTIGKSITFRPKLDSIIIGGSPNVCPFDDSIDYWVENNPGIAYQWSMVGGNIINGQGTDGVRITMDSTGSAILSVIVMHNNGCNSDTFLFPIAINVLWTPPAPISTDTICWNDRKGHTYSATYTFGASYYWHVSGGQIISGDSTFQVVVDWDTVGTGLIWYEEENITVDTICFNPSDTTYVIINPSPPLKLIIGDFEVCEFDSLINYSVTDTAGSLYEWTVQGGIIVSGDSTDMITVSWDTAGTYLISVVETNVFGCMSDTLDTMITVYLKPIPININGEPIVCGPDSNGVIYWVDGGSAGSTYMWTVKGGAISSGAGTDSIQVDWILADSGTIKVVELTTDSCLSDTLSLKVQLDNPIIEMEVVSDGFDNEQDVRIQWEIMNNNVSNNTYYIYRRKKDPDSSWKFIDSTQTSQYLDKSQATSLNSYEYRITGINACDDTVKSAVHHSLLLEGLDDEDAREVRLNWNSYINWKGGVDRYEIWRKLDNEMDYTLYNSNATDTSVLFLNGADGNFHCYRILAHEQNDTTTSWSNEICLEFGHLIEIPNAFSPNGDGVNDTWVINNLDIYPENTLEIYNRWGSLVYKATDYLDEWDGMRNGNRLADGNYYYVLKVENVKSSIAEVYTGSVLIMR